MIDIGDYKLNEIIGKGSFGLVYKGVEKKTNEPIAIKLEKRSKEVHSSNLKNEIKIYKDLCGKGIPKIKWIGKSAKWNIMVIEYLGPSLEDLFELCHKQFSLKTILMITIQILTIIQHIHNKGYIHRDIKPDNFLIGYSNKQKFIHIIDFGLSKQFINNDTFQHEKYVKCKQFIGSFRYSSLKNHLGIEQSRRDDLESIGYMLLYFLKKKLPWQSINGKDKKDKMNKIFNIKKNIKLEELCKDCPKEFLLYLKYCRKLRYTEKPDYFYLKQLFQKLLKRKGYKFDYNYDWCNLIKKK